MGTFGPSGPSKESVLDHGIMTFFFSQSLNPSSLPRLLRDHKLRYGSISISEQGIDLESRPLAMHNKRRQSKGTIYGPASAILSDFGDQK